MCRWIKKKKRMKLSCSIPAGMNLRLNVKSALMRESDAPSSETRKSARVRAMETASRRTTHNSGADAGEELAEPQTLRNKQH